MRLSALTLALSLAGCGTYDQGGSVYDYSMRYHEMEQRGETWHAPDYCGSACALGLRNTKVCYRPEVVFEFHCIMVSRKCSAKLSEDQRKTYPEGLREWIARTGAFTSKRMTRITGRDLAAIDGRECA